MHTTIEGEILSKKFSDSTSYAGGENLDLGTSCAMRLRMLRRFKLEPIYKVSKAIGISSPAYRFLESEGGPSIKPGEQLEKLADFFGLDEAGVNWLLNGVGRRPL